VHSGQDSDGWHGSGTDLDNEGWDVGQHRMGDVADEAHQGGPDQEGPEEARHANLPTITHCFGQLLDIIRSRNLQTVTLNDLYT
jgi:hypothetical protein